MTTKKAAFRYSDAAIIRLKAQAAKTGKEIIKFEPGSGLGARVSPTGSVSWAGQLRRKNGLKHRWRVGPYPAFTCDAARDEVRRIANDIALGIDPVAKKAAEEAEAVRVREAEERAAAEKALTLRVLVDQWGEALATKKRSPGYIKKTRARIALHFPGLIDLPAASLTAKAIKTALKGVKPHRTATTRQRGQRRVGGVLAMRNAGASLRACLRWAGKDELIAENPIANGLDLPPANDRDRMLSLAECRRIYAAAGRLEYPDRHFVQLLLLTGARRSEIAGLKREEIVEGPEGMAIVLPRGRTKTKSGHHIPLAPEAAAVIEDCRRQRVGGSHLLSHGGWCGITNFGRVLARLERAIGDPPVTGWVLHDFRAALVSNLAERGFDPTMLDRLLGHAPVKLSRVARVYQRAEQRDQRREALCAWAKLLTQTSDIVPLERALRR
jgi:integrase